jgi:GDSL-like lipase/acylhydrolase family protein
MLRTTRFIAAAALGILLGVTACHNDELFTPQSFATRNPLFDRYVSMGNSITAGYQSGGINDSTQLQSYAVLLSRQMATPFFVPLMNKAGCPPPIISVFANPQTRVGPPPPNGCALREAQPLPPPYINNVAVPGAEVMDGITNLDTASNPNGLTTMFLGGYTQTSMMEKVDPTFVTVWLGNNDVLGAATYGPNGGDSTRITSVALFQARYGAVLDSIATTSARGGVLIGVANVTLVPYFSKGSTYWAIKNGLVPGAAFPPTFAVSNTCAPLLAGGIGDSVLVPFPFGIPLVAAAQLGASDTLKCTEAQTVQPAELLKLSNTVTAYNAYISAQATARGYAYFDPNALFTALPAGSIPAFPNVSGASAVTAPFGNFFSRDGVHPSALAHKLVANALIPLINGKYGTSMKTIP